MRHRRLTSLLVLVAFLASPMAWAHVSAAMHPVPDAVAGVDPHAHDRHAAHIDEDSGGESTAPHTTCCHLQVCSGSGLPLPCDMHSPLPRVAADTRPPGESPLAIGGLRHEPPLRPPRA